VSDRESLASRVQARLDRLTKPPGSLGELERIAIRLALVQGTERPAIRAPHVIVFAGDHGAAAAGLSAYPSSVTAQMVANFLNGGAAISVFAEAVGLPLLVVDAGVARPLPAHPRLRDLSIAPGTRSFLDGPAMTTEQCTLALVHGASVIRELASSGCTLVVLGEMGIGNTSSAALLVHRIGALPLDQCVGPGAGLDTAGLVRKRELLARAAARAPHAYEPRAVLAEFGGFEIAMLVGALLECARSGIVAIVDGYIVASAVLVASAIDRRVRDHCIHGHVSAEPGHRRVLDAIGARPLLDLDLRLGEASGAALAYPLVLAAERMLNRMATFEQAGVDDRTSR
jgi:nicotinate-nucleotide--dimethylbenzimidazole phosphoribosyltransferase